jgi:FMN-dependent NADH-azoreductase
MAHLLFVNASPRAEASESLRIAETLLEAYAMAAPFATIDRLELFDQALPVFGHNAANAKMTVIAGRRPSGEQDQAWAQVKAVVGRVQAADTLLFTAPMWNAGIPWALKHFIDTITQPGLAFRFDPATGYHGLLGGRRAIAIYTSSVYRPGIEPAFGADFHSQYLNYWLHFCGIEEVHELRLQPTFPAPDLDVRRDQAYAAARDLGRTLGREHTEAAA